MEDARHYCQQRHGDLASITSKEENIFLWKQVIICVLFFTLLFAFLTLNNNFDNLLTSKKFEWCAFPYVSLQISRSYGRYYIGLSVDLDGSSW